MGVNENKFLFSKFNIKTVMSNCSSGCGGCSMGCGWNFKTCLSCGMPMITPEDFPAKDTTKECCVHCTNEKGELLPKEEIIKKLVDYYCEIEDVTREEAEKTVIDLVNNMPAWN